MRDEFASVLLVLEPVTNKGGVSASKLFEMLPWSLRKRWTEKYLVLVVLPELIRDRYIDARQAGPGQVNYQITGRGLVAAHMPMRETPSTPISQPGQPGQTV